MDCGGWAAGESRFLFGRYNRVVANALESLRGAFIGRGCQAFDDVGTLSRERAASGAGAVEVSWPSTRQTCFR